MNDVNQLFNRLILTDNVCSISNPIVYMYGLHKILYCTNVKAFAQANIDLLKNSSLIIVNDSINQGSGNEDFCAYAETFFS